MADSRAGRGLTLLQVLAAFLAVLTVVVGNGGQRTLVAVVGVVVLVVSLLALTRKYVISSSRTFWFVVAISALALIGYGILFPAVPPIDIPAGG